ncbi:hypothetical protein [Crocosphaera subtropica]|nr:hypothetical protein [Crocosphaera subtropica]
MASIVLSFVGNQDPASETTNQEGSIITLIRHLIKLNSKIRKVILLYTEDTKDNAILTKEWLQQDDFKISTNQIELIAVSSNLSDDPVDVKLATQEANKGLKQAKNYRKDNDIFEFNSSSGTPSMKTAWGILQASSYGINSRLWQVRNPKKIQPSQELVFENNVNVFKDESNFSVIKKQLQNYNYSGAIESLNNSDLDSKISHNLMEYGYYRLAFDFQSAREVIQPYQEEISQELIKNINDLYNENILELLQEVYYKGIIKIKNKQYADFLVLLFSFQENILKFLVKQQILKDTSQPLHWKVAKEKINYQLQKGELNEYLKNYSYDGRSLKLNGDINRIVMLAILDYFSQLDNHLSQITLLLKQLENYCQIRNELVHDIKRVSELENESEIIKTMREILILTKPNFQTVNPFNLLNEQIVKQLTPLVRG